MTKDDALCFLSHAELIASTFVDQDCTETDLWTACRRWGEWTERFSDSARSLVTNFKYYLSNIPAGDWMLVAGPPLKFPGHNLVPRVMVTGVGPLETVGSWGPHGWGCRRYPTKCPCPFHYIRPQWEVDPLQPWRGPSPEPSWAYTMILNFQPGTKRNKCCLWATLSGILLQLPKLRQYSYFRTVTKIQISESSALILTILSLWLEKP